MTAASLPSFYPARPEDDTGSSFQAALESISDAFYAVDEDWRLTVFNRAAEAYFGAPRQAVLGKYIWELFPKGAGTPYHNACVAVMANRRPATLEAESQLRPGRVAEMKVVPMPGGGIAVVLTDITERRQAEQALREELRRREEILESISDAFYSVDADGRLTYVNRMAEAWWGRRREDLLGKKLWEEFPGAVGSAVYEAHVVALRDRRVERVEAQSPVIGGWLDVSVFPRRDGGLSVYFRDISARKKNEELQQLLLSELTHRVKNILATVQAIATQSLKSEEVAPAARERFMERLLALARATDVLVAENWEGASLESIARQAASPHAGPEEEGRFSIAGPPVRLSPGAATAFALALHELTTNAAKYGALSTATGSVALSWAVENADVAPRLELQWRERGGPAVEPPKRSGFGLRLLERGLATELDAEVRLEYHRSGLTCDISAPLPL